jgi:SulP family sulfate permease
VLLLYAVRLVRKPLVIPIVLGAGVAAFAIGTALAGAGPEEVKAGGWLLGPFESARLWEPWTLCALSGADWSAVLGQWAGIATAVFVACLALLFDVTGTEVALRADRDTNRELRDAGFVSVVSGASGGIPGSHALRLTSPAARMRVNARAAGLVACLVPLAAAVAGGSVVELIPRMIVGGVLVFLGLGLIVEWVWDRRRSLARVEHVVVIVILAAVVARGFLPGVVLGLVLAVVLFAINYGRIELVRSVAFGETYRSNVDRPAPERAALRSLGDRVEILRVHGFVFFGTASGLLGTIRRRVGAGGLRYLVVDLRGVTGVDASAVASFAKVVELAETDRFELVLAGAPQGVRRRLERGGVAPAAGVVAFEPDLDRALQRCEDGLLAGTEPDPSAAAGAEGALQGVPPGLSTFLERVSLAAGDVLIRQEEPPGDVFVLESGRLRVEMRSPEGDRMRLRALRPGAVVGEVAMYTGEARTADVVAETPSVVLRLGRASIERIRTDDPQLAAALHRWLATTLATRLTDAQRTVDTLVG